MSITIKKGFGYEGQRKVGKGFEVGLLALLIRFKFLK